MNLSKSRFCSAVQCNKKLWLELNKPEVIDESNNESVLDNGIIVGEKAREYFGDYTEIKFSENLSEMIDETLEKMKEDNIVIAEASFVYENNFCSVDILKKTKDEIEIYEVKSSTEVKDIYLFDLAYQVYVLTSLGYKVKKASITHINSNYIRKGKLDLKELFCIVDKTQEAKSMLEDIKLKIDEIMKQVDSKEEPQIDIGLHCVTHYKCPFFKYCTKSLPENNVFKLRGMKDSTKFGLYKKGIISYEDILKEDIDEKYRQQIEFEIKDMKDYIDKEKIKQFLDTLSYPLYFLDFETYQQPIPEFDNVKPYMQIPFQYSLHYILNSSDKLEHKEFLAESGIDPRRSLAEQLVKDIPMDTCVIAYNMMFEKMVIKNLASIYPDLSNHLMNIYENMHDLMIPFKKRDFYTKEMYGSYSIKYVLPALFPTDPSLDYHNLELVHNGSEAMNTYAKLQELSKDEQQSVRACLLKYCELDTYAMVKIWEYLKKQIYI